MPLGPQPALVPNLGSTLSAYSPVPCSAPHPPCALRS